MKHLMEFLETHIIHIHKFLIWNVTNNLALWKLKICTFILGPDITCVDLHYIFVIIFLPQTINLQRSSRNNSPLIINPFLNRGKYYQTLNIISVKIVKSWSGNINLMPLSTMFLAHFLIFLGNITLVKSFLMF
jgi:hypothetical protein